MKDGCLYIFVVVVLTIFFHVLWIKILKLPIKQLFITKFSGGKFAKSRIFRRKKY